jgi:adsorption protein B
MLMGFTFILMLSLCIIVIEDFILDMIVWLKGLFPKNLTTEMWQEMQSLPEKPIAIIVANWHEAQVIERMILGNLKGIHYKNYHFFIGVYPNDLETLKAAKRVEDIFPHQVHVIVNPEEGPTSKGQMLNEIVRNIFRWELILKIQFEIFLMQDSEDILHPRSLKLINSECERSDFLQTPVFSFKRGIFEWIGATYVDEFSEMHTKDLLIREFLKAPVPSAGVGTAIRRSLMLKLIQNNHRNFLREDSLTEDYVLGMTSAQNGFDTGFCSYYFVNSAGKREMIATREYFPSSLATAIRQKTRWVLGIVFQGSVMIPWVGPLSHKYYLFRDRRGPIVNLISFLSLLLTFYFLMSNYITHRNPGFMNSGWFFYGSIIATYGLVSRLLHRIKAVVLVNGWQEVWQIPLRWPIGIFINVAASLRAFNQYQKYVFTGEPLRWAKTSHVLPENFGIDEIALLTANSGEFESAVPKDDHATSFSDKSNNKESTNGMG